MRQLNRNKQAVYYANYVSKSLATDEQGNTTNEWAITYSKPIKAMWNVSFVQTSMDIEIFGIDAKTTLRIVAQKSEFALDEASILWYGKEPETPYDAISPKHNYVVAGIRPSLNEVVFYAKKVDVS